MNKNILAIVSSPRKGGNSEMLVDEFIAGAKTSSTNRIAKVILREKKISPCLACEVCLSNGGSCVQDDDMREIIEQIIDADVIVLSTPVYYYSISAQLKTMIDRTLAGGGKIKNKEFYFIATAADGTDAMECTMNDMQGFVNCIPGSVVKGKVYGSAFHVGEIKEKSAMKEARNFGRTC